MSLEQAVIGTAKRAEAPVWTSAIRVVLSLMYWAAAIAVCISRSAQGWCGQDFGLAQGLSRRFWVDARAEAKSMLSLRAEASHRVALSPKLTVLAYSVVSPGLRSMGQAMPRFIGTSRCLRGHKQASSIPDRGQAHAEGSQLQTSVRSKLGPRRGRRKEPLRLQG